MTPVSTSVVPDQNEKFHPFSRLPLEIRRLIWRAALPGPRDVVLEYFCLKNPEYPIVRSEFRSTITFVGHGAGPVIGFAPINSNPAIFYTCRESFKVASETYTLTFGSLGVKPRTWFNYDIDSVHLDVSFKATKTDIDNFASVVNFSPRFWISLPEISGLDNAIEVVYVTPDADGIYRPIMS